MRQRLLQAALWAGLVSACQGPAPAVEAAGGAPPFKVTPVADFSTPWAMDFLRGSGRPTLDLALVSEKEGKLWLVDVRDGSRRAVSGLPAIKVAGQGGLGDVVVHPDYAANGRVYLSFVEAGEGGSGAALGYGRLLLDEGSPRLDGFKVIWRQSPKVSGSGHFSHRIAFGPDALLYLTSGDRQKGDPAQDPASNLGKLLRLTDEGAPAPGNPWASRGGVTAQHWSIGHRNLLGLSFDADGRLWQTEMGPEGGDEVNLVKPGLNYGWPRASNGSDYGRGEIPDHRAGDGFEAPKVWWTPSISPGGSMVYRGDLFPGWKGDLLVAALSGEALIRVDLNGDTARKAEQWPMGTRIRAVDEGPDGRVYLLEDGGRLVRLDPSGR